MRIGKEEHEIFGNWITQGDQLVPDDNSRRIEELVAQHLEKIGQDQSGWDVLYRDPLDGRFWELLYLQSEGHAGGPPTLREIGVEAAKEKYGVT